MLNQPERPQRARQPIFNLPRVVSFAIAALVAIHFIRNYLLPVDADLEVLLTFAFIPARISEWAVVAPVLPGGDAAAIWSFVTYALLHADWGHVSINALWLAAFGSPLAWRFGPPRFLLFSAAGAAGGALLHLAIYPGSMTPMVGASAAISAHMAGVIRFVFTAGGSLRGLEAGSGSAYRRPAAPLSAVVQDSRALAFLVVWFAINFLFGVFGEASGLASGAVAWDAHIGGFVTGLFLFSLFDPVGTRPSTGPS